VGKLTRPLRVEIVGLFPEFYRLCPKGVNYLDACGLEPDDSQVRDYPARVQAMGRRLQETYVRLMREFGDRLFPVSVGLTSLRGLWLVWKHRLSSQEVYVVVGDRAIPTSLGYPVVREAVRSALARATASANPAAAR